MVPNKQAIHVLFPVMAACVAMSTTSIAQECVPPPSPMIGWWPGHGDAEDITGFGNDGTLMNGVGFGAGKVGLAFSLDGVDDYIVIPNGGGIFDFDETESFSWDAWFKSEGSSELQTIVAKESGNYPTFNALVVTDGRLSCALQPNAAGTYDIASTSSYTDGTFHHVACIANRDGNTLTIIVDGGAEVHQTTFPIGSTFVNPAVSVLIGARAPQGPQRFFNGEIDEVEIINRALAPAEVSAIFNAGSAGKCRCGNDVREGNELCDGTDDAACLGVCGNDCSCPTPVPAMSDWGMAALIVVGCVAGTVFFRRRRSA